MSFDAQGLVRQALVTREHAYALSIPHSPLERHRCAPTAPAERTTISMSPATAKAPASSPASSMCQKVDRFNLSHFHSSFT